MMINVPTTKVYVKPEYLGLSPDLPLQEAYLIAVEGKQNESLKHTIHLSSGALFGGLPIECLYWKEAAASSEHALFWDTSVLQPYSCTEGPIHCVELSYLRNYQGVARIDGADYNVEYMFTISYSGIGLTSDPEQNKTHNYVKLLDNGQIAALPNNKLLWIDEHFTDNGDPVTWPPYRRVSKKYLAGS
jgi:hypothetical protein